jgi:hypothetical protein
MEPFMSLVIGFAIVLALYGLIALFLRGAKLNDGEACGTWDVSIAGVVLDTFGYTYDDLVERGDWSKDQIEDEACAYAMFVMWNHESQITPSTQITVESNNLGRFVFLPDYENGELAGLQRA